MRTTSEQREELKKKRLAAWNCERDHLCDWWYSRKYEPHPANKYGPPAAQVRGGSAEWVSGMDTVQLAEYVAALHNALPSILADLEDAERWEKALRKIVETGLGIEKAIAQAALDQGDGK